MGKFRSSSRVAWLSALILIFGIGSAQADKRVALVIGNSQYTLISPKLANPSNDAHDLAEALKGIGFEVILKTDIGKGDFDRSLAEFARKASGADTALFYYAGHGLQYQRQNYFLPVDIKVEDAPDVEFTAIGMDRVLEAIDKANGVKVLILDACRDNPLAKQVLTRGVGGSGELMRGLARLDRTEGLIIAYATAPDQVAQDGSGRNSPFTEALIRRIKEPGLEIGTMFRRVTSDVFERTNGRQRPEISISLLTDYFLNPSVADSIEWGRIRNSDDEDVFKTFIRKYPESPYARDAQYRIDLFERIKREQQDRVAREEEQKLKDEEAKRQKEEAEKERQRIVDLCAADRAKLSGLVVGLQSDAIQKLGKETACPTLQPDVDKAFKDVNLKLAEEQKRKDEEARRQKEEADKEKQRIAGLCDRDLSQLQEFAAKRQTDAIQNLSKETACPTLKPAIDKTLREVASAVKHACEADRKTLNSMKDKDVGALKSALGQMSCETVQAETRQQIDKAEREQKICTDDKARLANIDASAAGARQQLVEFRSDCPALKAEVSDAIKKMDGRVKEAQTLLAHLGCYSGTLSGRFDEATQKSLALYHSKKNSSETGDHLNDDVLSELRHQELGVCPTEAPSVATVPEHGTPPSVTAPTKPKIEQVKREEEPRPKAKSSTREEMPAARPPKPKVQSATREEQPAPRMRHKPHPSFAASTPKIISRAPRMPAGPVAEAPPASHVPHIGGVGF